MWKTTRQWLARRFALGFVPMYFKRLAQEWQDVLWGSGLMFVAWSVWITAGNPPAWVNWTAIALAAFWASYFVWRAEYLKSLPGIVLGDIRVIPTDTNQPGVKKLYGQIHVTSTSGKRLTNCRGFLLRIEKWRDDKWNETTCDEPIELLWSVLDQPLRTLEPGMHAQLNIFSIQNTMPGVIMPTHNAIPIRCADVLNAQRGDVFKFDISVSADECVPAIVSLRVVASEWDKVAFEVL